MADPAYTQDNRPLSVSTPLGKDKLLLESMTVVEGISEPFLYTLSLLAPAKEPVAFEKVLAQKVTVTLLMPDGETKRYFSGFVTRISQGRPVRGIDGELSLASFTAEVRPQFWLLSRRTRSRIFQDMSVPDILEEVLSGVEVSDADLKDLKGKFKPRDCCVQYRESDFAFATRLMEEEGIYYFFKHSQSGHSMVLADSPQKHPDLSPGPASVKFRQVGGKPTDPVIFAWDRAQEFRSHKTTLRDYHFELAGQEIEKAAVVTRDVKAGSLTQVLKVDGDKPWERYDFPGGFANRFDDIDPNGSPRAPSQTGQVFPDGERTAKVRMEQEAILGLAARGESHCRNFTSGQKFKLEDHFNGDGEYVLTRVEHELSQKNTYTTDIGRSLDYSNRFACIPAALPFRPQQATPRPRVGGVQTAVVVGAKGEVAPSGDDIFTDKYGRVKVLFNWDRKKDREEVKQPKQTNWSCWVRVGTAWAGQQWGAVHIPRVGQEVIVAFEDGDPDAPIVVGSVYNAKNMPPYVLPDNKTQSGIKSRSTPNGTAENFNEVRFEDKKDSELISVQAEKDMSRLVKNDDKLEVQHDQSIKVKNNRTEEVTEGDETVTVKKGKRAITVEQGDDTTEVKQGDFTLTVGQNTFKITNAGAASLEAKQSIELKVGGNTIKITATGIELTVGGNSVKLDTTAGVSVAGTPLVKIN